MGFRVLPVMQYQKSGVQNRRDLMKFNDLGGHGTDFLESAAGLIDLHALNSWKADSPGIHNI